TTTGSNKLVNHTVRKGCKKTYNEVNIMSMPNIPNITPEISLDRCEVINLLLSSIALEEIGLSHILNAEGEKLQYTLKKGRTWKGYLLINDSVNTTLRTIVKSQMLLQFKLEDVVALSRDSNCNGTCEKDCADCYKHRYSECACGI